MWAGVAVAAALLPLLGWAGGDSTFECHASEHYVPAAAYDTEPMPQQRCVATDVQLARSPLALHAYVRDPAEARRLQRRFGGATGVKFHQHVVDLPLVIHDQPLPTSLCSQHINSALAFSVPDLGNLYHTLFDMLVPLADTLRSLNQTKMPQLLAVHNPVATRAQPWLLPIRTTEGYSEGFFKAGDSWDIESAAPVDACRLVEGLGPAAYQFLDYLAASGISQTQTPPLLWLTPPAPSDFPSDGRSRRQHRNCLTRFDLHRGDGHDSDALKRNTVPDVVLAAKERLCVKRLDLNIRARTSLWQYEGVTMEAKKHAELFDAFRGLFRRSIPQYLGLVRPEWPPAAAAIRTVGFVVRGDSDTRPTQNISALEAALNAAVTRTADDNQITIELRRLDLAQMTLKEQVRAFGISLMVVGDHGAGLSNLVFMPEGSSVVELTHVSCGRHCGDYFRPAAELSGVHHWVFNAERVTSDVGGEFVLALSRALERAIGSVPVGRGEMQDEL